MSVALAESGDLERLGVELIGANLETIHRAEDRSRFKETMAKAGLDVPRAGIAHTLEEALGLGDELGFPVIVRPSFTLGGGGSGFAASPEELMVLARRSLAASPVSEILVEESIAGWKEFELEVMRDRADNAVVVCSIENIDPMGVHTGDSVTVAPQQTLTDREYQAMRDDALGVSQRGRRRDGRFQRPVRGGSGHRASRADRDESAREPFVRARVEGDGVPYREDRRTAGGWVSA